MRGGWPWASMHAGLGGEGGAERLAGAQRGLGGEERLVAGGVHGEDSAGRRGR